MSIQTMAAKTAEVLRARRWTNCGDFVDDDGCVCLLGALGVAAFNDPNIFRDSDVDTLNNEDATALHNRLLLDERIKHEGSVAEWNDSLGLVTPILALLDRIAGEKMEPCSFDVDDAELV